MISLMNSLSDFRLSSLETIWLSEQDYLQAKQLSDRLDHESQQWQSYLQILGIFALENWLKTKLSSSSIQSQIDVNEGIFNLIVDSFRITSVVTEEVLSEQISIASTLVENPSHFYVLIEVNEEEEEAILRGCLRYDELSNYISNDLSQNEINLPLDLWDSEPHHLLFYCQHLEPSAITLPAAQTQANLSQKIQQARTQVSEWLQGVTDNLWLNLETLLTPEMQLALNVRTVEAALKKGKKIRLGEHSLILLLTLIPKPEERLQVLVQLYPDEGQAYLPENLCLKQLNRGGKVLQETQSGSQDNYIQLNRFTGKLGQQFSLEITSDNQGIQEDFEL